MTHLIPLLAAVDNINENFSFGWQALTTLGAMVFVIALAILFIRYVMPHLTLTRRIKGSQIHILDRTGLEPRKALYLVRVGDKTALIGTSDNAISKIMDVSEKDLEK